MAHALEMIHTVDPKEVILKEVGDRAEKIRVCGPWVLVAVYERPERTKSGLYLSDTTRQEDKHQGKAGLVLQAGPIAFYEDDEHRFGDAKPKVGDWVAFNVGDGWPFELGGRRCRLVQDIDIRMVLTHPDAIW